MAERKLLLLREIRRRECRASLEAFCTDALAPLGHKPAAHHRLLIRELEAIARGENQRLMVFMPPGSAKSTYASKLFPAWLLAQRPDLRIIGASHTATLAEKFSRDVQTIIRDNATTLGYGLARDAAELWETSNRGEYRAVGVRGSVTGTRGDCAIIDDPVKSREDADSEVIREKTWAWFLGDLRSRLKPNASIVLIQTRWHADDLGGRLLQAQAGLWRVICLPATAVADDPLGRAPGELLWQDDAYGYGAELAKVRAEYEQAGAMRDWWSLYEQSPRPSEGALFKTAMISTVDAAPIATARVRRWDLAATARVGTRDPDWTVGVLMSRASTGRATVEDVVRFRGGPSDVEAAIVATAQRDGTGVQVGLPIDPGQAGVAQAQYLTSRLAGFRVEAVRESGDKATRAAPFASQCNVGNVALVRAPWNRAFLDELSAFPSTAHDDQVDAAAGAFGLLSAPQPQPARFVHVPRLRN